MTKLEDQMQKPEEGLTFDEAFLSNCITMRKDVLELEEILMT